MAPHFKVASPARIICGSSWCSSGCVQIGTNQIGTNRRSVLGDVAVPITPVPRRRRGTSPRSNGSGLGTANGKMVAGSGRRHYDGGRSRRNVAMYCVRLGSATPFGVAFPFRPRRGQERRSQLALAGGVSFRAVCRRS